eukprot:c20673_g1_i1.p1 GENE.c20673_g1_i1~~c20673_g1_i1.p1  ORF type:complete len:472 (+),score=163.86 c20673_g1_i1:27-1442(+)
MGISELITTNEKTPLMSPHPHQHENTSRFPTTLWSHNVKLAMWISIITGIGDSTWSGTVIVSYIYILTNSNSFAGFVEAAQGMAQLLTALPVGYLADRNSRSSVIRWGGVITLIAIVITSLAVYIGERDSAEDNKNFIFYSLITGVSLWGVSTGIIRGPLKALYADSLPTGTRSKFFSYLYNSYTFCGIVGPIVSIIVFTLGDDQWHLTTLRDVILVGMAIEAPIAFLMFFFDDKKIILGRESTEETDKEDEDGSPRNMNDKDNNSKLESFRDRFRWTIPYFIFVGSVIIGLGSGMTVKFFPLFFMNDCHLSPSQVQAIYVVIPVFMVLACGLAEKVAKKIGRVQTSVLFRGSAVIVLFAMVYLQDYKGDWRIMVPLYVVRVSAMNATYPLEEAVTMDFVPKSSRARWKSLESIAQFGWCGSAAIGGILADANGYPFTFLITACIQSVAVLMFACLLPLVPCEESSRVIEC